MIEDPFRVQRTTTATSPGDRFFAITPNDATDLAIKPRAIVAKGGGDLALVGADGVEVVIAIPDGGLLPLSPHRVKATGTTATGIVGVW